MPRFLDKESPQLYQHYEGTTFCVLDDSVLDTSYHADPDVDRRMILYTDGKFVFVQRRSDFFGTDTKTGKRRFVLLDNLDVEPVRED
jgi:hypothetical protein